MATISVPSTADLATVIASAHAGDTLDLTTVAAYPVTGAEVKVPNLTLKLNGATLLNPSTHTGISVRADNFSIFGGNVSHSGNPFLRIFGKYARVSHINVSNAAGFIILDRWNANAPDNGGGDGAIIADCTGQNIGGDFIYDTCDNAQLLRLIVKDSSGEHCIRCSQHNNGHVPANVLIDGCDLANADGKETIALRGLLTSEVGRTWTGPHNQITNNKLRAWMRTGQDATAAPPGTVPPTCAVKDVLVQKNHFVNKAYLQINQGSIDVVADQNLFDEYASYCPIHVLFPNVQLTLSNNRASAMPGQKVNGILYQPFGTRGATDYIKSVNNMPMQAGVP